MALLPARSYGSGLYIAVQEAAQAAEVAEVAEVAEALHSLAWSMWSHEWSHGRSRDDPGRLAPHTTCVAKSAEAGEATLTYVTTL